MQRLILLIPFILFFSCKKKTEEILILNKNKETFLLFKTIPKDTIKLKRGGIKFSPVINLISDNDEEVLEINENKKEVKITNKADSYIRHVYRMDDLYFELDDSDTIVYYEKNDFPFYKTKNKLISISNEYEFIRKNYLNIESPSSWLGYYFLNIRGNKGLKINNIKKEFIEDILSNELKELHLLDSLYKSKRLTFNMFELQKNKLRYNKYNTFFHSVFYKNKEEYLNKDTLIKHINKPKLLKFKFYRTFLNNYLKNKFAIKMIEYSNNSFSNPKTFFDSIAKTKDLDTEIKEFLLAEKIEEIAEKLSSSEFLKYLKIFKGIVKDSATIAKLESKYLINYSDLKKNTSSVHLITKTGEKIILQNFINKHKGNLIYIDFWASWCAPCIKEFPSSNQLQEIYKGKNVTFLYISNDSDKSKWENANVKHGLINKNSFLAINYPNAKFYQELDLKTIPRYLLYNKKGKLIHKNAPRPSSNEIRALLDKHLEGE